jgi:hypothetical protein
MAESGPVEARLAEPDPRESGPAGLVRVEESPGARQDPEERQAFEPAIVGFLCQVLLGPHLLLCAGT